jgi:hypothetical protein
MSGPEAESDDALAAEIERLTAKTDPTLQLPAGLLGIDLETFREFDRRLREACTTWQERQKATRGYLDPVKPEGPLTYAAAQGRWVRVSRSGSTMPPWQFLTSEGFDDVAADFGNRDLDLVCMIKTESQVDADWTAWDTAPAWRVFRLYKESGSTQQRGPTTKRPPKTLDGLGGQILKLAAELRCGEPIPVADLVATAKATLPFKPDKRGHDRREDRVRQSIAFLVKAGRLQLSGDDDEFISAT